jgi:hypothetical protein
MHVVGELQLQHYKSRARIERIFRELYRLTDLCQIASIVVYAALAVGAMDSTFQNVQIWQNGDYDLHMLLDYKTQNCTASVSLDNYRSYNIDAVLNAKSAPPLFSTHAANLRLAFIAAIINFLFGVLNRGMFVRDVFFITVFRKLRVHKDMLSVLEVATSVWTIVMCVDVIESATPLRAYLTACGVRTHDAACWMSIAPLLVSAGTSLGLNALAGLVSLIVSLCFDRKVTRCEACTSAADVAAPVTTVPAPTPTAAKAPPVSAGSLALSQ